MKKELLGCVLLLVTGLVSQVATAGKVTYIHTDAQGTPIMESDAQGNITARFDYTPYGMPVQVMSGAPDGPGYAGHVNDPDTGFVYMQARYYDPMMGRFLSVDPIFPYAGSLHSMNGYEYVYGNPVVNIDPDGRFGRGVGFSGSEWRRFNRAQQSAARRIGGAASRIRSAMKTGKGLADLKERFEGVFGKGSATAENMGKVASELESMASALKDDGSNGFIANGSTGEAIQKTYGVDSTVLAGVPEGSKELIVNLDHPEFGSPAVLQWAAGHESAHAAFGAVDKAVSEGGLMQKAYKMGSADQQRAFGDLPSRDQQGALQNPDTIMDYVQ